MTYIVLMERKGSICAVAASGIMSISLSLIAWKPRMLEPSKPTPSAKVSSSTSSMLFEVCCQVPNISTKRKSKKSTPSSLACFRTSAAVLGTVPAPSMGYAQSQAPPAGSRLTYRSLPPGLFRGIVRAGQVVLAELFNMNKRRDRLFGEPIFGQAGACVPLGRRDAHNCTGHDLRGLHNAADISERGLDQMRLWHDELRICIVGSKMNIGNNVRF